MLEQVLIWTLTILVVPVYWVLRLLGDLLLILGKFLDSAAENVVGAATNFADFVLRRD